MAIDRTERKLVCRLWMAVVTKSHCATLDLNQLLRVIHFFLIFTANNIFFGKCNIDGALNYLSISTLCARNEPKLIHPMTLPIVSTQFIYVKVCIICMHSCHFAAALLYEYRMEMKRFYKFVERDFLLEYVCTKIKKSLQEPCNAKMCFTGVVHSLLY